MLKNEVFFHRVWLVFFLKNERVLREIIEFSFLSPKAHAKGHVISDEAQKFDKRNTSNSISKSGRSDTFGA